MICAAGLFVYLPTPGNYWIRYDNELLIRGEPLVKTLSLEETERTDALVEMFTTAHGDLYQPLLTFSLAIDYKLFGWNRAGFHAHSLALHLAIMVGVFGLALRLVGRWWAAWLGVLLATVHPILVETVSWVIHRTMLVAAAWIVLGTHAYLSYARDPRRWPWLAAATIAYAMSLLGKTIPAVLALPFIVDLWIHRGLSVRLVLEKVPLAVAVAGVVVLNLLFSQARAGGATAVYPWAAVLTEGPAAFVLTAANLVFPSDLALFYPTGRAWQLVGARWVGVLAFASLVVGLGAFLWRRGIRGLLLSAVVWAAVVVPFIAAGSFRDSATADRYAYIGTLFLALGIAAALAYFVPDPDPGSARSPEDAPRRVPWWSAGLAVLALAVPLALQARSDARKWADEAALWNTVIARSPSALAYGALGNVYAERRDWAASVDAYEKALAVLPSEPILAKRSVFHLNAIRYALAADEAAGPSGAPDAEKTTERYLDFVVRAARDAIKRWPENPEFPYQLARALLRRGDAASAVLELERVLDLQPKDFRARTQLAIARWRLGQEDRAMEDLQESFRINPRYPLTLKTFAESLEAEGYDADAGKMFFNWASAQPRDARAHRGFFAVVERLDAAGAFGPSEELLQAYVRRFPDAAGARRRLALTYVELGKKEAAEPLLRDALAEAPEDAELRAALDRIQ